MSELALFSTRLGETGPRVVFLHGLFGQGKNWTAFGKALAPQARVSLVDLPDHGRSGWTDAFSYAGMADRVAALMRTESEEPYAVVGHSLGGKVAMTLALRHPESVARLCVVDVSPVPRADIGNFGAYVAGMRSLDLVGLRDRAAADAHLQPYAPEETIRSFLLQNLRREPGGGWRWQMNLELLGSHLDDVGDWPDPGRPPYPGPVLWLAGASSGYVRPEYIPAMRALFPRVRLVTVKGAAHWVHSDQPAVFLSAIRQFLHLPPLPAPN